MPYGVQERLNGSYQLSLCRHMSAPCALSLEGQALTFYISWRPHSCSSTLSALSWGKAQLWTQQGWWGAWWLCCSMLHPCKGKVISPPVLKGLWGCQPAQGRIHMVCTDTPTPIQQTLVGLSLLIRSQGAGSSSASSLLQHLQPGDQDSAVEKRWLPALSHLVCCRSFGLPGWLSQDQQHSEAFSTETTTCLAFHRQEKPAEAVIREQICQSPRGNSYLRSASCRG